METIPHHNFAHIKVVAPGDNPSADRAAIILDDYFNSEQWELDQDEAFPHQQDVIAGICEHIAIGHSKGYVELPTSTGKTYLMAKLAEIFHDAGLRVLLLGRTQTQATQLVGEISEDPGAASTGLSRFGRRIPASDIGRHFKGDQASPDNMVVVSTYAGFNRFAKAGSLGEFDVVLADEAHRGLGNLTCQNLQRFSPDAIKIGFTATPHYSSEKSVRQVFEHPIHEMSIKEAAENDLIAPITSLVYTTDSHIPRLDDFADFSQRELRRLIDLKSRNDAAIEFAKGFVKEGRQGIIACLPGSDLLHARELARQLNGAVVKLDNGRLKFIRAAAIHKQSDRDRILKQYAAGLIDVLTFVDSIGEGWDSQVTSFVIDTCPTTSVVRKKQRMGRALRRKPGNLEAIYVDFVDIAPGKPQVTALDALDERQVVVGRIFGGKAESAGAIAQKRDYLQRLFSSEIWHNILSNDAVFLNQLRLRANPERPEIRDPLFRRWEKILAKEGLPAEPANSMGVPVSYYKPLAKMISEYASQHERLPTATELEWLIQADEQKIRHATERPVLPRGIFDAKAELAHLALHNFEAETAGLDPYENEPDPVGTMEEEFETRLRDETLAKCLAKLTLRERQILSERFGLVDGQAKTLAELGRRFGRTNETIRRVAQDSLIKLMGMPEMLILEPEYGPHYWPTQRIEKMVGHHRRVIENAAREMRSAHFSRAEKLEANYRLAVSELCLAIHQWTDWPGVLVLDEKHVLDELDRAVPGASLEEKIAALNNMAAKVEDSPPAVPPLSNETRRQYYLWLKTEFARLASSGQ